jgi:hypothetical protein
MARWTTVAATALTLLLAGSSSAGTTVGDTTVQKLTATLNAAQEVGVAVKVPGAAGRFKATLDGRKLTWSLTFHGLSGQATGAHIHLGKKGVAGAVAVALCGPCRSGAHGTTTVTAAVVTALMKGRAYANVHTAKNAGGEIRGQVEGGNASAAAPSSSSSSTSTGSSGGGYTPPGYGSGGGGYDDDGGY